MDRYTCSSLAALILSLSAATPWQTKTIMQGILLKRGSYIQGGLRAAWPQLWRECDPLDFSIELKSQDDGAMVCGDRSARTHLSRLSAYCQCEKKAGEPTQQDADAGKDSHRPKRTQRPSAPDHHAQEQCHNAMQ